MTKLSDHLKKDEALSRLLLSSSDYREYLRHFFKIKKSLNSTYSYAVFARQAKVSKSLPRDIIEGLKRLTDKTLPLFVKAMELDGLMEEFFIQLVSLETEPRKKKLVESLASLYIETHFIKTYNDSNFKDYRSPFLYAASGEVGQGVTLETLAQRTGLSLQDIEESLPQLEQNRLGKFNPETKTFIPSTPQIHVESGTQAHHFVDFYLYCLNLQKEAVREKINSDEALFYNEVFSIDSKDLPAMKKEMKKVLKSFLIKSENSSGDSVALMNLGLFKQDFKKGE